MTKVLILAAGRSKRMAPVKDKNFLNFLGEPLIRHQINFLLRSGLKDIILIGGKHNLAELKKLKFPVLEQKNLDAGMCGAVLTAKKYLKKESVVIVSSNDIVEENAFELIKKALKGKEAEAFLLAKKVNSYFPGGYLKINQGYISDIIEKPAEGKEPSNLVNIVVHAYKDASKLIKNLETVESRKDDLYETAISKMIKGGIKFKAIPYDGFWQPIKYPWHVQEVFKYLFSISKPKISKKTEIAKNAVIKGKVIIEDGVKIFENAVLHGPVYIGKNTIIANNALVRESHVGENCVVGFSSEIARSFLQNNVWTHSNYIGDSIIGNNVSFGAGAITGNLRLDEKNILVKTGEEKVDSKTNKLGLICGDDVRIGVNTSLMPGIKVGSNTLIGAGITVAENISANSFARGSFTLKITENKIKISEINRDKLKKKL